MYCFFHCLCRLSRLYVLQDTAVDQAIILIIKTIVKTICRSLDHEISVSQLIGNLRVMECQSKLQFCMDSLYLRIIPHLHRRIVHGHGINPVLALNKIKAARHRIGILNTECFQSVIRNRKISGKGFIKALVFFNCQRPSDCQILYHIVVVDKSFL